MANYILTVLDTKLKYRAGETVYIDLPRNRYIQQIQLGLKAWGNTGVSVVPNEDKVAKLVKAIRVVVDGKDTRVNIPLASLIRYNKYQFAMPVNNTLIEMPNQSNIVLGEASAIVPFQLNPRGTIEDVDVLLDAYNYSSLALFVDWAKDSDIGSGYTVTDAEITICLREVELDENEISTLYTQYLTLFTTKPILAATQNYGYEVDLPTGRYLWEVILEVYRNGVRSNTQLTEFKVVDMSYNYEVIKFTWDESQKEDAFSYQLSMSEIERGFTLVGLSKISGLDLTQYKSGDIKLKANVVSPLGDCRLDVITLELV